MALVRVDRASERPNRNGLNSLRMENSSPDFDDKKAAEYWVESLPAYKEQAKQTYVALLASGSSK